MMSFKVDNIELLRRFVGKKGMIVATKGYHQVKDGGQNVFYWDEDYKGDDNQGTVIKGLEWKSGAWIAVQNKKINVRQFGAKGNGRDNDGVILRHMFSVLKSEDEVEFSDGIYMVDAADILNVCLFIDKSIVLFSKKKSVIKCVSSGARSVVRLGAAVILENIIVDCDFKANHAVECVKGASGSIIKGCIAKNASQYFNRNLSAALFVVVSEVNIKFTKCIADLAIGYVNGIRGDVIGTARGFLFYGKSVFSGENVIDSCIVDNIVNDRGVLGYYEDEDGVVSQLDNSYLKLTNNIIKNCMKRGVKVQNPCLIKNNLIITSRKNESRDKRMYSAISIYSDNVIVEGNKIYNFNPLSLDEYSLGDYFYGIEVGVKGRSYNDIYVYDNDFIINGASNVIYLKAVYICGVINGFFCERNKFELKYNNKLNETYGIYADLDVCDISSLVVSDNVFTYLSSAIKLIGPWSGEVVNNSLVSIMGSLGGIIVDGYMDGLSSSRLTFSNNKMILSGDNIICINTNKVGDMLFFGNTSDVADMKTIKFSFFCPCIDAELLPKSDDDALFCYCFFGNGKTYR
ncbi:MAG: hypothetical protein Q7U16_09370 [Agitococcus sp.]|nr:hypothetical protein [Agitococcus sp.]